MNPQHERAAFEKSIDENPLDSNTHRVYADWLDENGEHDEAAFRRSLGDWLHGEGRNSLGSAGSHGPKDYGAGGKLGFPQGVLSDGINRFSNFDHKADSSGAPKNFSGRVGGYGLEKGQEHHPSGWYGHEISVGKEPYFYRWTTYRGMEEGLRRAFMHNLRKSPERMARAMRFARRQS